MSGLDARSFVTQALEGGGQIMPIGLKDVRSTASLVDRLRRLVEVDPEDPARETRMDFGPFEGGQRGWGCPGTTELLHEVRRETYR